jgi:hypothetical protein
MFHEGGHAQQCFALTEFDASNNARFLRKEVAKIIPSVHSSTP